jgi:5'(3')-deoxyribonucleotidase
VIQGAIETLKKLNDDYEVLIVSAVMEFPNSLDEKYYWLEEHFPFISWERIVLYGSKTVVKGDILIDDHFRHLNPFENRTLLFTQPHNNYSNENGHERVNNWDEIARLLL